MSDPSRFEAIAARRTAQALAARLVPLETLEDRSTRFEGLQAIGSPWTRRLYDGPFHLFPIPEHAPAISLVFVRSGDGNTVVDDPGDLGGGPTDRHLIYEGISRVAADAVLAGATTAASPTAFFSVWHPELVEMRAGLGLPRHPVQIVISGSASFRMERALLCSVPSVRAFILTSPELRPRLEEQARERPWVSVVGIDGGLARTMRTLLVDHGIRRISAIGGPRTATALVDAGLVQDVHLTTTGRVAGEKDTPFYSGNGNPGIDLVVRKRGVGDAGPIVYEQTAISGSSSRSDPTRRR